MCRTKFCVPGGTLAQFKAGDTCSPACVYFGGMGSPSGHAVVVNAIAGRGGAAGCPPGVCANVMLPAPPTNEIVATQTPSRIGTSEFLLALPDLLDPLDPLDLPHPPATPPLL